METEPNDSARVEHVKTLIIELRQQIHRVRAMADRACRELSNVKQTDAEAGWRLAA